MLVLSLWVVSAPKSLRAAVLALCAALMPPCTTRYLQPPPALPLLSKVRCSSLCISSSSSYQSSLLPTVELLCQGRWGQRVPGEGGAVLGLGGSEIPIERERIRALLSALHCRVEFFMD